MESSKAHYLSGILLSAGANLAGMGASLVTIMIAARLLSKEELGAFFLIMVVVQFVALFSDLGLKNTAIRVLSSLQPHSLEFSQTAHYLLTITVATSIVACVVLWAAAPLLSSLWSYETFQYHLVFVAPIAVLTAVFQIVTSLLVGGKEFKKLSMLSAGIEVLRAVLSTGALMLGWGVNSLLWGMIISRMVGIGAIWILTPTLFSIRFGHPRKAEFFKFGGWLYGGSLLSASMVRCADAMLTTYMGTAALAVYSAAMQIPTVLQRVFESTRPTLLGYLAAHQNSSDRQQVETMRILAAGLSIATIVIIVFSGPLMTALYSEQYASGTCIMQTLSVWMAFSLVNYFYSLILVGKGQSREAFMQTVPQLFIMLVSTSMLVPRYEGVGAAIALVITSFLGNLIAAKIVAGDDRGIWWTLTMNFIRVAIPLLLFLIVVSRMKLDLFSLMILGGAMLALLIVLKVIKISDITAVRTILSRKAQPAPARSTTIA
ncbi:MAG: oligosaccharide flippase family protein [Nitrospira sp.]|nr:oligosaccharide flippase family protein [Nitrospira sp.]